MAIERAFKRFERVARTVKNDSWFTDQKGTTVTRDLCRLFGWGCAREAT